MTTLYRMRIPLSTDVTPLQRQQLEQKATSWADQPSKHLDTGEISLLDGGNNTLYRRIYTDGSKTDYGFGAAYCVYEDQKIIHSCPPDWESRC